MHHALYALVALFLATSSSGGQQHGSTSYNATGSWCADEEIELLNFRLENNGKIASICEDEDGLTYSFGYFDGDPEFTYSGKEIAGFRFHGAIVGYDGEHMSLADLAADEFTILNALSTPWNPSHRNANEFVNEMKRLAGATSTSGFIVLHGLTGYTGSVSYIFRNGGWEYAISASWGRPIQVSEDELEDYDDHSIMLRSPDGLDYQLR